MIDEMIGDKAAMPVERPGPAECCAHADSLHADHVERQRASLPGPASQVKNFVRDFVRLGAGMLLTWAGAARTSSSMQSDRAVILTQPYAGLQAQAKGLAERAGLAQSVYPLVVKRPWRWIPAACWPTPLAAIDPIGNLPDGIVMTVGGTGAAIGAALRRRGRRVVQIQNPRMRLDRFDLVVANTHDELEGPNVLVSRNALHGVGPARLQAARARWSACFAALPRPLVAVLVGGSNGRYRLDPATGVSLADQLATMMRADRVGLMVTPSRRTGVVVTRAMRAALEPLGGWIWNMEGENPYLGMLACADAIIVTTDSVSMISEAAATSVPVMVADLPGRSRRIGLFVRTMQRAGRVRMFAGRLQDWQTQALDDTPAVAHEMLRRLGMGGRAGASEPGRAGDGLRIASEAKGIG
jgi:uncharacterized protein